MACRDVDKNDLASKYLNGQLDPAAQDDFELHILECRNCQHSLEALQAMRDVLAARAHEIRSYSSVAHGRLRWEWIGAAALFVVACGFGLAPFALHRLAGSKLAQQKSPTPNLTANKTEVSAAEKVSGLSSKGVPETHSAPSIGPAPTSGLTVGGAGARPNQVSVDGADAVDKSVNGIRAAVPKEAMKESQLKRQAGKAQDELPVSSDLPATARSPANAVEPTLVEPSKTEASQTIDNRKIENLPINNRDYLTFTLLAVEVARLGKVTPPTFTFSEVAVSKKSLFQAPLFAFDASRVGGSSHSNTRSLFQAAIRAYAEKRYGDAKALLEDEVRLAPDVPEVNFFLGVCRLVTGKPSSAVQPLQSVLTNKESPYVQSAHFYLAKAYLQLGDLEHAEAQLEAAAAMPGQLQAEAKSTLTELQSFLATEKEKKRPEQSDRPN